MMSDYVEVVVDSLEESQRSSIPDLGWLPRGPSLALVIGVHEDECDGWCLCERDVAHVVAWQRGDPRTGLSPAEPWHERSWPRSSGAGFRGDM